MAQEDSDLVYESTQIRERRPRTAASGKHFSSLSHSERERERERCLLVGEKVLKWLAGNIKRLQCGPDKKMEGVGGGRDSLSLFSIYQQS